MNEEIRSFPENALDKPPFFIQMAGISYCDGSYRIARNDSDIYCLEWIIKGTGTIETPSGVYRPKAGDAYLLHAGERHLYYSDGKNPWTKIWVNFKGSLVEPMLESYGLSEIRFFESTDIESYLRQIHRIAWSSGTVPEIMGRCSLILHELFLYLYRERVRQAPAIPEPARQMKDYLDSHIAEKLTLSDLSGITYLSVSQMIRIFKEAYGETPYEYLTERRLETAKLLLRNTTLPVREVAARAGFADEHYFSGFFKEKCGTPPKVFRKLG